MISTNLSVVLSNTQRIDSGPHFMYISSISATRKVWTTHLFCGVFSPNCRCTTPLPGTFSLGHFPSSIVALWRCGSQWSGPGAHGGISPTGGVGGDFEGLCCRSCLNIWVCLILFCVCDGCLFSETGRSMFVKCVCEMNSRVYMNLYVRIYIYNTCRLYLVILFLGVRSVGIWVVASPHEKCHAHGRRTKSSQGSMKKWIQYV